MNAFWWVAVEIWTFEKLEHEMQWTQTRTTTTRVTTIVLLVLRTSELINTSQASTVWQKKIILMILRFCTDRSGQTVKTLIRWLLWKQSDLGLHSLPFHLVSEHYCMVKPGVRLGPDSREKWLLPPGKLGSSDTQIGRSYSAWLRHFWSTFKQNSCYIYYWH